VGSYAGTVEDERGEARAPICPYCGVTALPAEISSVLDPAFVCDNEDCDAFGDEVS
jgi:hypothetical protein